MLGNLFGKKETIEATAGLADSVAKGLDSIFTSDEERGILKNKGKEIVAAVVGAINVSAHNLNEINAKDTRFLHSGWRPCLGWVASLSVGLYFVPKFVLASWAYYVKVSTGLEAAIAAGTLATYELPVYPVDDSGLWQLITLLLGAVTVRSADKYLKTAKH